MKEISIVALCSASGGRLKSMSGLSTKQCSAPNNPAAQMTFMLQRKLPHINSNQLRLSRRGMSIKKRGKVSDSCIRIMEQTHLIPWDEFPRTLPGGGRLRNGDVLLINIYLQMTTFVMREGVTTAAIWWTVPRGSFNILSSCGILNKSTVNKNWFKWF